MPCRARLNRNSTSLCALVLSRSYFMGWVSRHQRERQVIIVWQNRSERTKCTNTHTKPKCLTWHCRRRCCCFCVYAKRMLKLLCVPASSLPPCHASRVRFVDVSLQITVQHKIALLQREKERNSRTLLVQDLQATPQPAPMMTTTAATAAIR